MWSLYFEKKLRLLLEIVLFRGDLLIFFNGDLENKIYIFALTKIIYDKLWKL